MITFKALEQTTEQEIFDKVVQHLRKQGKRAATRKEGNMSCLYRTEDGLACAVGCLISDEEYAQFGDLLEGSTVTMLVEANTCDFKGHHHFLSDLQVIHDAYPSRKWEDRLEHLANTRGLKYTPPQ